MDKDLRDTAIKEFDEISAIVESHKNDDLGVLCELLGGHNLDDDYFDLNYKSLCVTIMDLPGYNYVHDHAEVWDEDGDHSYLAYDGYMECLRLEAVEED